MSFSPPFSIRITEPQMAALEAHCASTGLHRQEVLRRAIDLYLATSNAAPMVTPQTPTTAESTPPAYRPANIIIRNK